MQIDREKSRGRLSAAGQLPPAEAVELARSALAEAQAERLDTLILDFKDMSLTRIMSTTECYGAGERLANAGKGLRKVAFLARPDCLEPHAFALTVAFNRGLSVAHFESEADALGWLVR